MADTTTPRVTYFDSFAGRAMPVRMAFHLGGVKFDDEKLSREEFAERKAAGAFPLGQVPVLTIGDKVFPQSHAALLYAAKKANLLPEDDVAYAEAMSIVFTVQEAAEAITQIYFSKPESEEEVKKINERVKRCILYVSKTLGDRKTFGGEKLNVADVVSFTAYLYVTNVMKDLAESADLNAFKKYGEHLMSLEAVQGFMATASEYSK